jgi:type II secretory pathway predicted ATPase ExeA
MTSASASADDGQAVFSHRMDGDPFQPWCDEASWYPDTARENSLKLLLHLAPYSDLLLVTGESGVGKSLFIKKFIAGAGDAWRMLFLPGGPALDDATLLHSLDQEFSVRTDGDADREERLRRLRRSLFVLRRGALLPVLVVDDAHLLPFSAFRLLLELTEPREDGDKPLAVVLAGEGVALAARIQEAGERLQARIAHVFELQPFSEAATESYIRHRLDLAGVEAGDAFTPAVIRFIHTASRGLPGRINEYARVVLEEKQRKSRKAAGNAVVAGPSDVGILLRYGLAALVVALGGLAFVYREDLPALIGGSSRDSAIEQGESSSSAAGERAASLAYDGEPVEREQLFGVPEDVPAEPVADPGEALAEEWAFPEEESSSLGQDLAATGEPGDGVAPGDSTAGEPESVTEEQAAATPPAAAAEQVPRREAWLLAQAPDAWTVQVFASREERLLAFIEEHGLKAEAAVFRVRGGDPPLYALVWGVFPSRALADQAVAEDLARIPGIKPWVRSLRDVQAAITAQGGGR